MNASVSVVLGTHWGDEGKVVDILANQVDVVCRCQGGNSADHTIVVGDKTYHFQLLPSGVTNDKCVAVIGNGVVIHVPQLLDEIRDNEAKGLTDWKRRLVVSDRAHLVFDFHQIVDGLHDNDANRLRLGTTKKGIGPTYATKARRSGVRVGDLVGDFEQFEQKFKTLCSAIRRKYPSIEIDEQSELDKYKVLADQLRPCVTDTVSFLNVCMSAGKTILVEGSNASMLDIDFGTYPYVSSCNSSVGGVCTGLGIPARVIGQVYGVSKAYCTRLGTGPFPTEVSDHLARYLQDKGHETGVSTGSQRRVGWLDAVVLRYSHIFNGYSALAITKLDVLDELNEIKIGVSYELDGIEFTDTVPALASDLSKVRVNYQTFVGWQSSTGHVRRFEDLPERAKEFIRAIERLVDIPVKWVGVGPDRETTINLF